MEFHIKVDSKRIIILSVIKGLVGEEKKVRNALERYKPDMVGIALSKEELTGLKKFSPEDTADIYLSDYEEIYAANLRRFGKIRVPPPCYEEAYVSSVKYRIPIVALDMSEDEYTIAYCRYVTGLQLVWHSLRKSFIRSKKFKAKTAEEFVIEWDRKINNLRGFRALERRREQRMAEKLVSHTNVATNILAIIELERAKGVADCIRKIIQSRKKS